MYAVCVGSPQAAECHTPRLTQCFATVPVAKLAPPSMIQHLPPSMLAVEIKPIDVWGQSGRARGHYWVVTGLIPLLGGYRPDPSAGWLQA